MPQHYWFKIQQANNFHDSHMHVIQRSQDFIRHILNYTEYNQPVKCKSGPLTVQLYVTQHKRIYINVG